MHIDGFRQGVVGAVLLVALTTITACDSAKNAENAARFAATRHLSDPATAEFRAMRTNTEGVTCGEVRGRDKGGQPSPFRKFIYFAHTSHVILQPSDAEATATAKGYTDEAFAAREELSRFEARYGTDCR